MDLVSVTCKQVTTLTATFVEEADIFPSYIFGTFVKNEMGIVVWILIWVLYSIPLVFKSVFVPIPCCFYCYCFVIQFEVRYSDDPAIPLLEIHPKECNTGYSRGTCTPMFIAALFTIAKLWKQPRCPTTNEWNKKIWYLYTMEFYSAMKKNEILSFAGKWVELENIILSEVSQAQKTKNRMFSLICGL
jgi:hypothetical protein